MEGNTQQQIATDLKTILPEHPPQSLLVASVMILSVLTL
jgi:hypothetical protein